MCTEAQGGEMIKLLEALAGNTRVVELLSEIKSALDRLVAHQLLDPDIWRVPVSTTQPLRVDKRGRDHLYLLSSVAFELFFVDGGGQAGNPLLPPFTVPAGKFVELPFLEGHELAAPGIAIGSENVVFLLAQNEVLAL